MSLLIKLDKMSTFKWHPFLKSSTMHHLLGQLYQSLDTVFPVRAVTGLAILLPTSKL